MTLAAAEIEVDDGGTVVVAKTVVVVEVDDGGTVVVANTVVVVVVGMVVVARVPSGNNGAVVLAVTVTGTVAVLEVEDGGVVVIAKTVVGVVVGIVVVAEVAAPVVGVSPGSGSTIVLTRRTVTTAPTMIANPIVSNWRRHGWFRATVGPEG